MGFVEVDRRVGSGDVAPQEVRHVRLPARRAIGVVSIDVFGFSLFPEILSQVQKFCVLRGY